MCECFSPAFSDEEFGYALGVGGQLFNSESNIAFELFDTAYASDNQATISRLYDLQESLELEIARASKGDLKELGEFKISWGPIADFQSAYLAGLKALCESFESISSTAARSISGEPGSTFHGVIFPWAEEWQKQNHRSNIMELKSFAEDTHGYSVTILTDTRSILTIDGVNASRRWLETEMFNLYPVEVLLSEIWAKIGEPSESGVLFASQFGETGPSNPEAHRASLNIGEICEQHWCSIVEFNQSKMDEHLIEYADYRR